MAETIECVIQIEAAERELWSLAEQILNAFERLHSLAKSSMMVEEHFGQRNIYLFIYFRLISAKTLRGPATPDSNASMKDLSS